ncbi:MAG: TolC family protein [Planctomycetota bacterium]
MLRLSTVLAKLRSVIRNPSDLVTGTGVRRSVDVAGRRLLVAGLGVSVLFSGCSLTQEKTPRDLQWADGHKPTRYYKGYDTAIEYPAIDNETAKAVQETLEPRSLQRNVEEEVRELTLQEAIRISLANNDVIESAALGGVGAVTVLQSPDQVATVYDSAIQETGILFGRRGTQAALSDFDARLNSSMLWGRNSSISPYAAPVIGTQETGAFTSSIDKTIATGGSVSVFNNWNYLGDAAAALYPSSYSGTVGAQVRQPLLAGSGVDYTRIAGPVRPGFGAISGVSQGVVIARINQDITLAQFEQSVRNGLRNVEDTYWDLYFAYRSYDTAVTTHESAFQTWRESRTKREVGTLKPADELQARDRFYETRAQVELALKQVYQTETQLRRMLAMPMNDGTVLRPADEPVKAEIRPDWDACLTNGLTHRVELRQQKWNIKSLQLQVGAARSLVRPQLDAVGSYGLNGFGDKLISQNGSSSFGSLTGNDLETWTMGVEMSVPIGLRGPRSQVRNLELQLRRANAILAAQERSISHEIAIAVQDVSAAWAAAQSNLNRLRAAEERVDLLEAEKEVGTTTLDLVLRAQASLAAAENDYYQQLVAYNKAITYLNLATGTLLQVNNIHLSEGGWCPEAYADAKMQAVKRTHAKDNPHLDTAPHEFVSRGPAGSIERSPHSVGHQQSKTDLPGAENNATSPSADDGVIRRQLELVPEEAPAQ